MPSKLMQGLAGEGAVVDRTAFGEIVARLQERGYTVYGTVNEKGAGIFRPLGGVEELSLRCTGGTLPPKHLWYPPFETLFTYDRQTGEFHTDIEPVKHAVFGIRPCDVHALLALDEVFLGGAYKDPHYRRPTGRPAIGGLQLCGGRRHLLLLLDGDGAGPRP